MKKTITVNLNQEIFNIDVDAYEKLQKYLDEIEKHYKNKEGYEEIGQDIESRIGEKLSVSLGKKKKVVTLVNIETIISEMGSINDIDDDTNNEENFDQESDIKAVKKLYRHPNNKIIEGVVAGIAEYFNIDITLLRILTVIAFFIPPFTGIVFLVYIVLALIVPEAKTGSEMLMMKGQKVTLSQLDSIAKEENEEVVNKKKSIIRRPFEILLRFINICFKFIKKFSSAILAIIGFSIVIGCALGVAGVVFASVYVMINKDIVFANIQEIAFLNQVPLWQQISVAISGTLVTIIPMIFLIQIGNSIMQKKLKITTVSVVSQIVVWFIALSLLTSIGSRIYMDNKTSFDKLSTSEYGQDVNTNIKTEQKLNNFSKINISGAIKATYIQSNENKIVLIGNKEITDKIDINNYNGTLNIGHKSNTFCMKCINQGVVEIYGNNIEKITLSGASVIEGSELTLNNISLDLSGASKAVLEGKVNTLWVNSSGASKVLTDGLESKNVKVETSGASHIEINAIDSIYVNASGASKIIYSGDPVVTKKISGASTIIQYGKE